MQEAILTTINTAMNRKEVLIGQITSAMQMELSPTPNGGMSVADIDRRLGELNEEFQKLFNASRSEGYLKCESIVEREEK